MVEEAFVVGELNGEPQSRRPSADGRREELDLIRLLESRAAVDAGQARV